MKNKIFSIVPEMSTFPNSNPDMYCNYAREDPTKNRCLYCTEECRHQGKKTVFVENINV